MYVKFVKDLYVECLIWSTTQACHKVKEGDYGKLQDKVKQLVSGRSGFKMQLSYLLV